MLDFNSTVSLWSHITLRSASTALLPSRLYPSALWDLLPENSILYSNTAKISKTYQKPLVLQSRASKTQSESPIQSPSDFVLILLIKAINVYKYKGAQNYLQQHLNWCLMVTQSFSENYHLELLSPDPVPLVQLFSQTYFSWTIFLRAALLGQT